MWQCNEPWNCLPGVKRCKNGQIRPNAYYLRPGYSRHSPIRGVKEKWHLIRNLKVYTTGRRDFEHVRSLSFFLILGCRMFLAFECLDKELKCRSTKTTRRIFLHMFLLWLGILIWDKRLSGSFKILSSNNHLCFCSISLIQKLNNLIIQKGEIYTLKLKTNNITEHIEFKSLHMTRCFL